MTFRILALGDIVGRHARNFVKEQLPKIIEENSVDFVIANGENTSGGMGLLEKHATLLHSCGVDVITSGNHIWNRNEIYSFIDKMPYVLRPANYPDDLPGKGSVIITHEKTGIKIGVLNLLGTVFMPPIDSPFKKALTEIEKLRSAGADIIVLDFHAEATAEKEALGLYLADKIELFFGTHTHVQTSDEKIINEKMGYITDLGRCGAFFSVIGFNEKESITGYLSNIPQHFVPAKNDIKIEGIITDFELDPARCVTIERIRL